MTESERPQAAGAPRRRARWRRWVARLGLLAVLLVTQHEAVAVEDAAGLVVHQIREVTVTLWPDGRPASEERQSLPLHWDAQVLGPGGRARVHAVLPVADPAVEHALLATRIGNAFRVSVNGHQVTSLGRFGDRHDDTIKRPRLIRVPSALLRSHGNELVIEIDAQASRKAGVSPLLFGPADQVEAAYWQQFRWRVVGSVAVAAASLVLGLVGLLLWWRQRDPLFLVYAAAELLWCLGNVDVIVDRSPLPWPWWGVLVYSAQIISGMLICRFALAVVGWPSPSLQWATKAWALVVPFALMVALNGSPELEVLILVVTNSIGLVTAGVVVVKGLQSRSLPQRVLAASLAVLGAVLVRDLFVLVVVPYSGWFGAWGGSYGQIAWARYAWVGFGVAMAWIIAERLRAATQAAHEAGRTLAQRLADQQRELEAAHARAAEAARHDAREQERQRLMQDMHDGLGGHLLGTLQLADDPAVPRERLVHQLRDALDQLKLTVDAMQDVEGDIAALLGALRYRLAPRLRAAGVELAWFVEHLPDVDDWTMARGRDLQLLLYEAFANVAAHARASTASLSARHDADQGAVCIALVDDGVGFDPSSAVAGRGLATMRARAERLGAQLEIASGVGGTSLRLAVPVRGPVSDRT